MSNNSLFGGTTMMGVCYSPYHRDPSVPWSDYTKADIDADLAITAQYFSFIRTYTVQFNQQYIPELCSSHGLGLALGAWIFPGDQQKTFAEIDTALKAANDFPDAVKVIVVGNEIDITGYQYAEVEAALNYAKAQKGKYPNLSKTPVTTCMTGTGPTQPTWSPVLKLLENYVFLTIYPWYAPNTPPPNDIAGNMQWSHDNGMVQAENAGLTVVIGEIGWPSDGNSQKMTSWQNEVTNFKTTCSWINGNNIYHKAYVTMWFEMFDEPWKTAEGAWGPHWGIFTSGAAPVIKSEPGVTFSKCS